MSNTKEELAKILKEHDQLTNQHTMEEKKMGKNLKENEAEKDVQATPSQAVQPADGTPVKTDASQNEKEIQAENEANVDKQAPASSDVKPSDGTQMVKDNTPQNSKEIQAEADMDKKDEEKEEKKIKKENEGEEEEKEPDYLEKYREMEGDMGKLVESLEAMMQEMDGMKKRMDAMEQAYGKKDAQMPAEMPEEPMEPVSESAILKNVVKNDLTETKAESFGNASAKALFRK